MEKIDWWGAQGHYMFSDTDHIGGHGGFIQWQYGEGFEFVRDLNSMSEPTLLPEVDAAVKAAG